MGARSTSRDSRAFDIPRRQIRHQRREGTYFPFTAEAASLYPIANRSAVDAAGALQESKRWRRILALGGGAGGFLAYMPVALSDSRVGVSDSRRLFEWSAVTAAAALLGYVIGKKLDRL